MATKSLKLPWMKFFPADWSKDPALTLCAPATRGIWIDLICAMHNLDQSGELRGTADQLARFARCTTVEFVQAMTDLRTNRAADVAERNGLYEICNRRMRAAYKSRKSTADRVQRHRTRKRNGGCNADETEQISDVRSQNTNPPPPPNGKPNSAFGPEWTEVAGVLKGHGVAKASEAITAARSAGCNANQVRNLIEFWRARQPAWGPGALYERLMRFGPDQGFDSMWPPCAEFTGYKLVTAAEFSEALKLKKFKTAPQRNAADPSWVFGTLRDGSKIECKDFPVKKRESV